MRKRGAFFADLNTTILLSYIFLVCIGWLNIYAATYTETTAFSSYEKQAVWIAFSFIIGSIILIIDAKFYQSITYGAYGFFIFLLLAVLVVGSEHKGAKSWFNLGPIAIQPTEFAKFATALALAKFMATFKHKKLNQSAYINAFILVTIPIGLIALQPDLGSCVVFLAFYFALFREGFPGGILIIGIAALILFLITIYMQTVALNFSFLPIIIPGTFLLIIGLTTLTYLIYKYTLNRKIKIPRIVFLITLIPSVFFVFFVSYAFNNLLETRHRDRLNELLGITHDPSGAGYNVHQSKIAIGSGGFWGKGYLNGTQTKYNFVPEQRTDFIFCTIGEEWGFVGSLVVIGLYLTLLTSILNAAERQKSSFSRIYGYSVASLLFFHFAINIGMTIGLVPVIGIPLPFFSYGGSSLWAFTVLLFIFLKLDAERKFILG